MRLRLAVSALLTALVLVACGDDGGADDAAADPDASVTDDGAETGDADVTIQDFDYSEGVTVGAGEDFVVTNADGVTHTFTHADGDAFDSGDISSGDTATVSVDEAGEYQITCSIHPSMSGSITVE